MSFSKPAFRVASSAFVLLELAYGKANKDIAQYGVRSFPNFAVLDAEGKVRVPPNSMLTGVVMNKPPVETVSALLSYHYRSCLEGEGTPCRADLILQHVAFLKAYGETTAADEWLQKSLANPKAKPEDLNVLKVYKALALRRAGNKTESFALLKEVAPKLYFQEPEPEVAVVGTTPKDSMTAPQVDPFVVGDGKMTYGRVSSDADPILAAKALAWLSALPVGEGMPNPEGKEPAELLTGAVSLAAVLDKPMLAGAWLAAYKTALGEKAFQGAMSGVLADGLVMLAEGKLTEGAARLMVLVQYSPEESFAPWAGVLAVEAARKAGDKTAAESYARQITDTYGPRLAQELKTRLG